jgi:SpoVK/Ycf46/Vps4 family AAA+-type ATPase
MKEKKLPTAYPLYETSYGSDIPVEQLFVINFDCLPSKHNDNNSYDQEVITYLKQIGFEEITRVHTSRRGDKSSDSLYMSKEKLMLIKVRDADKKNNLVRLEFVFSITYGELNEQLDFEKIKTFERLKKKSSINLVKSDMGHLDTEEYDLVAPDIDLKLNYGSEFLKVHDVIVERLNKPNDKGIILLHGDPGTGKTSYIKYLTRLVKDKEILFIPPSMAEMLSEPTIIPFLMDQRNTVLIIEDAERVISDREGNGSPAGVSNILNLTDGILGDCLNIQIIATFNMKRERIDQALLRKGRLIAEHKFEKLNVDETNNLLTHLGKDHKVDEGMVLADIYHIDTELYKTSDKGKIGFNK